MNHREKILILGATSSLGEALANAYAKLNYSLILTGRDESALNAIATNLRCRYGIPMDTFHLDVTDSVARDQFLKNFEKTNADLAGVIVCYGYLGDQEKSIHDPDEVHHIFDCNFLSVVSLLDYFSALFQKQKKGFIIALSSVAGDRGRQSNYYYGAAKGALTLYLQGLRNRLYRDGIPVLTIKLGFIDTKMTFGKPGLFLVASPEKIALAIINANRKQKDVVYLPFFWRFIMLIIKAIPEKIFKRLSL